MLPRRLAAARRADRLTGRIAAAARRTGLDAWIVGGWVRDHLAGWPNRDCDFIVRGDAAPLLQRLAPAATGRPITFRKKGITTHRLRIGTRWCDFVELAAGAAIDAELARRDFTWNSMAIDLTAGRFLDPFGGVADLRRGRIRAVSERSIDADPLRILRGVRFAAERPRFRILPATARWMRAAADQLRRVAAERITAELDRIVSAAGAQRGFELLHRLGALFVLLPEIEPAATVRQAGRVRVLDHTLRAVGHATRRRRLGRTFGLAADLDEEAIRVLGYAALFHDLGKPATWERDRQGRIHFYTHEKISRALAAAIGQRWKFAGARTARIERLVLHHLRPGWLTAGDPAMSAFRRVVRDLGDDLPLLLLHSGADRAASAPRGRHEDSRHRAVCRRLYRLYRTRGAAIQRPPRWIDGDEVMRRLGIGPGPRVGEVLAAIEDRQVDGEITTRRQALRELDRLGRAGNDQNRRRKKI